MAGLLNQRWLASTIEHQLKEVVEWKQRASRRNSNSFSSTDMSIENKPVRDFTTRDFSNLFKDDGSSLSTRWTADRDTPCAVQILEIFNTTPSFKCRLSDGYTTVKARLTKKAQESLLVQGSKNVLDLEVGQLLFIPEFEIKATTLGKVDERVQITIHCLRMASSMRSGTIGDPRDIHIEAGVQKILGVLKDVSHATAAEYSGYDRNGPFDAQLPQQVATQGSMNANGDSQTFATQVPMRAQRNTTVQNPSAVNLAAPIMPLRNDAKRSIVGSRPSAGSNGFRNPIDLLGFLPTTQHTPNLVWNGNIAVANRSVPFAAVANDTTREGATSVAHPAGSSPTLSQPRNLGAVDLTGDDDDNDDDDKEEEEGQASLVKDIEMAGSSGAEDRSWDRSHQENGSELANEALLEVDDEQPTQEDVPVYNKPRSSSRERVREARRTPLVVKSEPSQSTDNTKSFSALTPLDASKAETHSSSQVQMPWHGLTHIRRLHCIVPPDQQSLLDRKESWNPPNPGQQFPTPNIPRALSEQMQSRKNLTLRAEEDQEALELTDHRSEQQQDSSTLESSRSPSPTPSEGQLSWSASPPISRRRDELPPDSSAFDIRNNKSPAKATAHSQEYSQPVFIDHDLPPDSPSKDLAMKSVEEFSLTEARSRPISRDQNDQQDSQHTSNIFSSAVNPGRSPRIQSQEQVLLQPSTLPQSEFASPHKTHSESYSSPSESKIASQPGSRDGKIIASTYTPYFQSAQSAPGLHALKGRDHSPRSMEDALALDTDRMAEEQLQQELKASTQKPPRSQSPPLRKDLPSSPLAQSSRRTVDEMDVEQSTPPQILGKRVPSSPASSNSRPRKSRFGFSQEDPISQNPSYGAAEERRLFMAARKQENRQRARQMNGQQTSTTSNETTNYTRKQVDGTLEQSVVSISSSPPGSSGLLETTISPRVGFPGSSPLTPPQPILDEVSHHVLHEKSVQGEHILPLDHKSLLQAFSKAYPVYQGELKHFTNLINEIEHGRNPLHPFLWDDYVIRNKTDYVPYSIECLHAGERPISYETFYTKRIAKPIHLQGILTSDKLNALRASVDTRHDNNFQSSPRNRDRDFGGRSTGASDRKIDRYIPPARSSPSEMPAASTSDMRRAPKPKNSFFMMSFGGDPPAPRSTARSSNAFAESPKAPPTGAKNSTPASSTSPSSAASGGHRRLPWATSQNNRISQSSERRTSTASDSRSGPTRGRRRF